MTERQTEMKRRTVQAAGRAAVDGHRRPHGVASRACAACLVSLRCSCVCLKSMSFVTAVCCDVSTPPSRDGVAGCRRT